MVPDAGGELKLSRNPALISMKGQICWEGLKGIRVDTIIAVAVAVGVLKGQGTTRVEPPKVTVACDAAWHRVGCPPDKRQANANVHWELGY